jgi:Flp pilus assembly secretin CpaC
MVTPTVLAGDRIALKVAPEVSELDFSSSVDTGGVTVPGLRTRRADTGDRARERRELRDQRPVSQQLNTNVDKIPGLGDSPILGAFFKTTRFEREDRELLMIVSPHLVKPLAAGASKLPLRARSTENYSPGLYEMQFGETGDFDPTGPASGLRREVVKQRFIAVTESETHVAWLEESLGPLAEAVIADDVAPDRIAQLADAASAASCSCASATRTCARAPS